MTHTDGLVMSLAPQSELPGSLAPDQIAVLALSAIVAVVVMALGVPLVRALAQRLIDRRPSTPPLSADVAARLERIEHAVDTIAVEVERIAEAQRYAARLMADQAKGAQDPGRLPPSRPPSPDRQS